MNKQIYFERIYFTDKDICIFLHPGHFGAKLLSLMSASLSEIHSKCRITELKLNCIIPNMLLTGDT